MNPKLKSQDAPTNQSHLDQDAPSNQDHPDQYQADKDRPDQDPIDPSPNSLALDRTILANERTYQAWIRTGLALFIAGLGIFRFLQDELPFWLLMSISMVLVVLSAMAFLLAAWRYRHLHLRVARLDVDFIPLWVVLGISAVLAASALLALLGLFLSLG